MTEKECPPFHFLHPYSNWTLKVRVVRKQRIQTSSSMKKNLKLVLTDKLGQGMEAILYDKNVDRLQASLNEGKVYCLSNVGVQRASMNYRTVMNDLQCVIGNDTLIEELDDDSDIPMYTYNFITFDKVPDYLDNTKLLIDVIGLVIQVGPITDVQTRSGKTVPKRDVILMDAPFAQLTLTLWDELALDDGEKIKLLNNEDTIIVATSLLVKRFHVKEADEIKSWLERSDKGIQVVATHNKFHIKKSKRLTVKEIIELQDGYIPQEVELVLKATISRIFLQKDLWYLSCKICKKKIDQVDGHYVCNKCSNENATAILRYIVRAEVMDHTGAIILTIFDKVAEGIFGCTVEQLHELHSQDNGDEMLTSKVMKTQWIQKYFYLKFIKKNIATGGNVSISVLHVQDIDCTAEIKELLADIQSTV